MREECANLCQRLRDFSRLFRFFPHSAPRPSLEPSALNPLDCRAFRRPLPLITRVTKVTPPYIRTFFQKQS